MIRTVVKVDGMACSMCEAHINNAVRNRLHVKKVRSNRKRKETVIESEQPLDREMISQAIEETGYTFLGFEE